MRSLIRIVLLIVVVVVLTTTLAAIVSATTGPVEKVVLAALAGALIWLAARLRRIGTSVPRRTA